MKIKVNFNEITSFRACFVQDICTFRPSFGEIVTITNKNNVYEGDYNVIPHVYNQTLETKDKTMIDNITIEPIPIAQVINLKNGYTVTIG